MLQNGTNGHVAAVPAVQSEPIEHMDAFLPSHGRNHGKSVIFDHDTNMRICSITKQ